MPLRPHNVGWYWALFIAVLGWILWNFSIMPVDFKARPVAAEMTHEPVNINIISDEVTVKQSGPAATIHFTKKVACRHNIQVINTMVELWYIQHEGNWPKEDLSDIGHDLDYFPKGVPKCPMDGGQYSLDHVTHWVHGHDHGDVKNPFMSEPAFQQGSADTGEEDSESLEE